jgi:hypothetical protein
MYTPSKAIRSAAMLISLVGGGVSALASEHNGQDHTYGGPVQTWCDVTRIAMDGTRACATRLMTAVCPLSNHRRPKSSIPCASMAARPAAIEDHRGEAGCPLNQRGRPQRAGVAESFRIRLSVLSPSMQVSHST